MNKSVSVLVYNVFVALAVTCLLSSALWGQELARDQNLKIGLAAADVGSLLPTEESLAQDDAILPQIFERLTRYAVPDDPTSDVVPSLAQSWTISEDGLVYTFHLRKGVKFHKGYGTLTAEDVVFSFDLYLKEGYSAYRSSLFAQNIASYRAVDRYTFELVLKKPNPLTLRELAYPDVGHEILCKAHAENKTPEELRLDPIGTGPFYFYQYNPQQSIILKAFPDYWGGTPIIKTITYYYIPSTTSRDIAFLGGELDIVKGPLEGSWVKRIRSQGKIVDAVGPGFTALFFFNLTWPPLDKWKVRAAIAFAINREEISEIMGGGDFAIPQLSPIPEDYLWGTLAVATYDYNPARAKKLLAEAGFPNGFKLSMFVSERPYYLNQMQAVQRQLKEVGIDLELVVVDHTTFHANQRKDLNPLILFGDLGWNATMLFDQFHSSAIVTKPTGCRNYSHYGDVVGSVDDLLEAAAAAPTAEEKERLYRKVQQQVLDDLAVYPLVEIKPVFARQPWVDLGYKPSGGASGGVYRITVDTKILAH